MGSHRGVAFLIVFLGFAGCSKEPANDAKIEIAAPSIAAERKPVPVTSVAVLKPFRDVAIGEVPEGENRPPDATVTGLSVGKLYEKVAKIFDQIKFVDARGRKITYHATLKTDQGDLRIELLGDSAPNHVRNFIALARSGFYNGLPFHRSVRQTVDAKTEAFIEAGCPLGTGELGYGSIGYWLKAEPSDEFIHDEGIVGATHTLVPRGDQLEDLDNAACKFYIGLTRSPWRDLSFTIFGKVIQGLDVAHKINQRPNHTEPGMQDRPREPVTIRRVIIEEHSAASLTRKG